MKLGKSGFTPSPTWFLLRKVRRMSYQSINPFNGEIVKSFDENTTQQLEAAIENAEHCFKIWRTLAYQERAAVVIKAATIMRECKEEFARLITLEMGKLFAESIGEVVLSADILEYYAQHAERFLATEQLKPEFGEAMVENHPLGVLFGVQPWNFPYYQLARFAAPNLMAGNVVMVKHSGTVPQCAIAFEQLWLEAGAPTGAYTNLLISHDQVLDVIDDPRIQGVALTGGIDAAKGVAGRAGKNVKKTTMELGGSDAFIVLEDADLEKTLKWAMWAKMNNMGQCCIAAKRFIIVEALADQFLSRFKAAMEALKPGDPMDESTTLGPLSTEAALIQLVKQVDAAVAHGATLLLGGKRMDRRGAFMQPTILSDIATDNPAYREEFFGPVALFFRVKDEEAAILLANDSDYGLGGSVFTQDIERGKRVARRVETGMVFVNHPTWTAADLPFGGIKFSGYGRELSSLGIQEFVNKKLIRVAPIDAPA